MIKLCLLGKLERKENQQHNNMKKTALLFLAVFCILGLSFGQSNKTSIIITMAEQYDGSKLEESTKFMNPDAREKYVINELKQFASESQADLLNDLYAAKSAVSDITPYWIFNGISCKADQATIQAIAQRPDVKNVELDLDHPTSRITIEETQENLRDNLFWNLERIQADKVWNYNGENNGYTGKNIVIAILDSGVNYNHLDLKNHMWEGGSACPHHGWDYMMGDNNPIDDATYGNGQGTMVAGVIVGDGTTGSVTGIAQDAQIMAVKISNSAGVTNESKTLSGIQFAADHGAKIILITACETGVGPRESYRTAMNNLLSAGKIAVTAAGEQGQSTAVPNSINSPSSTPSPWHNPDETLNQGHSGNICVGATNKSDLKTYASSIGPVSWTNVGSYNDYPYTPNSTTQVGHIRPDITAPGVSITSAHYTLNNGYMTGTGTALSAAHVAAVIAMMLEANPNLTPSQIDQFLETSAVKCDGMVLKNNYYGAGRLDAFEAIKAVKATVLPPTNLTATSNLNQVTLNWTAANNAASYDIYCNEECIAQGITGTTYTDVTTFSGVHFYTLKSNHSNGSQSRKSSYAYVFVIPEGPMATNLNAGLSGHTVNLTWEVPTPATVMRYGNAETKKGQGGETNNPTYWAQRFIPSTLVNYAGSTIDSLQILFVKNANYDVYIYNGNPNGTDEELFHTTFTPTELNSWNSIPVPNLMIDHTKDLWIVVKAPKGTTSPAAYGANSFDQTGFPCMMSTDGRNWYTYSNSYAWLIKAKLSTSDYTYNVLRNGEELVHGITATNYTDNNVPSGVHYYTITTNYNNGNNVSFPSESCRVDIDTHFVVTLNPGSGTCSVPSVQQSAQGAAVTLPSATPSASCQAEGYTFAGWSTEIIEASSTAPADLMAAGSNYTPTDDITLYAVYKNIQGEQGWILARSINDGDLIRIVSENNQLEFNNINASEFNGTSVAFNINNEAAHPFTVIQSDGGYAFQDEQGNYLYKMPTNPTINLSNVLNETCIWHVVMINGIAYMRNDSDGTDHQLMVKSSSPTPFQCFDYLNLPSGVQNIRFYRYAQSSYSSYDHTPSCGNILQAPKIEPVADGIYLDPVTITMSSTASGVTIRYTVDGSEPNQNSELYLNSYKPEISTTTTIKARAFKAGYANSAVAVQTYNFPTEYANIAAFKAAANSNVIAKITSTMRVTHQYDRYLYVSDDSAGLLIFDDYNLLSGTYTDGDYIGDVQGRYQVVNGQPMLVLMHSIEKTGENSPVEPNNKTIQTVNNNYNAYDAQLMLFEGVKFTRSVDAITMDTVSIIQNGKKLAVRNQFLTVTEGADNTHTYDVIGLMGIDGTLKMVYPRSNNDIRQYYNITCNAATNGTLTAGKTSAACHSTINLTVIPDSGYHIESLYYYGSDPNQHIDIDKNTLSFEMPEYDITVEAVFEINVFYTVSFNAGSGTCATTSLTETSYQSGVVLPAAAPTTVCASEGYTFQGWADHFVNETMARPELYQPDSTYYPSENITLYAVYAIGEDADEWHEVTAVEDLIEGQYVVATFTGNAYYFLYQDGASTDVKAKRMNVTNGIPTKYMTQPDPKLNLWTIESLNNEEYSITYSDDNNTYYLKSYKDAAESIEVTVNNPNAGWVFTNNTNVNTKKGVLAQFPTPVPDKAVRYLDISSNKSRWLNHDKYGYIGEMHLYRSPSSIYSTSPECQMSVETPEFVDVPDGAIIDNEYMVTITCATPGTTIYYTIDGTEPDNTSTVYTGPFAITEDLTVKAIAYTSQGEFSYVATQTFTFVQRFATIAEFKSAFSSSSQEAVRITGDVTAVYQHEAYLYLVDETAALLVNDINGVITNSYNNGDVIEGGIAGKYQKPSSGQVYMLPVTNPAVGTPGTPVEPEEVTVNTLTVNYDTYDAKLVTIVDVQFDTDYDFSAPDALFQARQGQQNYININNHFNTLTISGEANDHFDISGFLGKESTRRIYPREDSDFIPYYNISIDEAIFGGSITSSTDHARKLDVVTLTATPQNGYALDMYMVTDADGNAVEVTGNSFEMPDNDVTVSAIFSQLEYNVTVEALPLEGGEVLLSPLQETYAYDDNVTVSATANPGFDFYAWMVNDEIKAYSSPYTFAVKGDMVITAVFHATENYHITVLADPENGGTVSGTGNYSQNEPVTVTATPNNHWEFVNWTEDGEEISTELTLHFTANRDRTLVAHFVMNGAEQTVSLTSGWSWFSSYIEYDENSLGQIQESIAASSTNALIKSQNSAVSYSDETWAGQLNVLHNEEMYLILSEGGEISLSGALAEPTEHPISISNGWNWIGMISPTAISVTEAMASITPAENDQVKGQNGFAAYTSEFGWTGALSSLIPGQGYIYLHNGEGVTLVYPANSKGTVSETPKETYWKANHHAYPTNLTMILTLDESQISTANDSHEIGAFVDGECRGSARLQDINGHHIAFLTVSGEDGEEVSFRLYDVANGTAYAELAKEQISYQADAVYGSITNPMRLHFGNTSTNELEASINLYPNPANSQVTIECPDMSQLSLWSLTGQLLRQVNTDTDQTQLRLDGISKGLYLISITTADGNTIVRKLEVR